ncbi:MAG: prolipoprotein diacylglyceryl transferase [Chloroflexi bacterium]|nr:prolipoprotein diacylglyceryl transferase [Chloroflexota bacterium]
MIDPVIFTFKLFNIQVALRWYGVLVMLGAIVGAWYAEREIRHRGENGDSIWDAMVWVLPIGIIGARVWFVMNSILGGNTYYLDNPGKIAYIWEGGLHFFGGLLFGAIALYFFLKKNGMDLWLFLDAIAPATLLGQALARPANYINQELYGQPTLLPWGIPIEAPYRLPQYSDLSQYPMDSTRFHPTFAYEIILNILIVLFLWWISRQYAKLMKPGTIFSAWLMLAGASRTFIEFFRPDQPKIGDSFVSYTMVVSILMFLVGLIMLLLRYEKLKWAVAEGWETRYQIRKTERKVRRRISPDPAGEPAQASPKTQTKLPAKKPRKKPSTARR